MDSAMKKEREYFEFRGAVYDITWESENLLIRHGGPWDRGGADSYYGRGCRPHFYTGNTGMSDRIEQADMTEEQILEYQAGYEYNETVTMDFKEW